MVEMSQEELLAAGIHQLKRRPEDVERAKAKLCAGQERNKDRFGRTHWLRPKKIEEGDWVLVYNSNLDNQHKATLKFTRRWFKPYVVTGVNDNAMYHLTELDGMRIAIPITREWGWMSWENPATKGKRNQKHVNGRVHRCMRRCQCTCIGLGLHEVIRSAYVF